MGIKATFIHGGAKLVLELPGQRKSLAAWADQLVASGEQIDRCAATAKDGAKAQQLLRHISGIERWGQRRLRVFLGESAIMDEYNGYRPATNLSIDEQRAFFRSTRAETVALVRQLAQTQIEPTMRVTHNDFGPLTPRGWVRYLDMHASIESKKIKS